MPNYSIFTLLKLRNYLSRKSNRRCILLILLSIQTAILDVISVASIIPFLGILLKSEGKDTEGILNFFSFLNYFFLINADNILLISLSFLCFIIIISSITRVFTIQYANKLVATIGHELSTLVFKNTFGLDFEYLSKTNLKETTAKLILYITKTVESLTFLTKLITALLIAFSISIFLVLTKPIISFAILFFLAVLYSVVGINARNQMNTLSQEIANGTENQIQTIQDIYSMSRNIYLDDSFHPISKNYYGYDYKNRRLYALSETLGSYPRFVIEAAAIVLIALITTILSILDEKSYDLVPFLGAFAFASQRLLPALQQIYANWAGIKANDAFVNSILKAISNKNEFTSIRHVNNSGRIKKISFKKVNFNYVKDISKNNIIKDFSFDFNEGVRVAIIGPTGIGKSTLLDIISCLRNPIEGTVDFINDKEKVFLQNSKKKVDSKNIKRIPNCSFVPQFNYVLNESMEKNIAISLPKQEINHKNLRLASEISLLSDFIEKQNNQYQFNPKSSGYSLSGGQIQRLAIARAIYKMSPILLLDEATSALDQKTAKKIIKNIFSLNHIKFIFAVTHSNEILKYFTHIIEFNKNGELKIIKN